MNKIVFTDKELAEIKYMYDVKNYSSRQIAKLKKVSKYVILNTLRDIGANIKAIPPKTYFKKEQWLEMGRLYEMGHTLKEVGDLYGGVHESTMKRYIERVGVDTRPSKKYTANYRFFKKIDCDKSSYWLAFITGDGSVNENELIVGLKVPDKPHVHKFLYDIDSNHPVNVYEYYNQSIAQVTIWSREMVADLNTYGIVPNKSLVTYPYEDIKPKYEIPYWRGLIDSDGYLSNDIKKPVITICGTWAICNGFKEWGSKYVQSTAKVLPLRNIFRYSLTSSKAIDIMTVLYKDSTIHLDRKHERAHLFIK